MPLRKISGSDTGSEESWEPEMQDFHHHHHQYHHQYYHQHQHQKIECAIIQTDITLPPQIFIFILKNNRGMQKKVSDLDKLEQSFKNYSSHPVLDSEWIV